MTHSKKQPAHDLESEAQTSSESWFERLIEPWLERCLKALEFITVAGLAIFISSVAIYLGGWVIWGSLPADRHTRTSQALSMLNENWKIGLILLIPLFYRTIRAFLERAEEFAGIKAPRQPVALQAGTPNPPPRDESTSEPES